jgi:hypothetical protein
VILYSNDYIDALAQWRQMTTLEGDNSNVSLQTFDTTTTAAEEAEESKIEILYSNPELVMLGRAVSFGGGGGPFSKKVKEAPFATVSTAVENMPQRTCAICFEGLAVDHHTTKLKTRFVGCDNSDCHGDFCVECIGTLASTTINSAAHYVPPVRCPGCMQRLKTGTWKPHAGVQAVEKFERCLHTLVSFRCPNCDMVSSLLKVIPDRPEVRKDPKARRDHLQELCTKHGPVSAASKKKVADGFAGFAQGRVGGRDLVETLLVTFFEAHTSGDKLNDPSYDRDEMWENVSKPFMLEMLPLVKDMERRVALLLAWLRKIPFFRLEGSALECETGDLFGDGECNGEYCFR